MIVNSGEPKYILALGTFDRNAEPSIEFTDKNNQVTNINSGRVGNTFAEFVVPGNLLVDSKLPATAKFKVGTNVVKTVSLELAATPSSPTPGTDGRGISGIARTSGNGAAGTTDTYTITYTDNTTSTFNVVNGSQGPTGPAGPSGWYFPRDSFTGPATSDITSVATGAAADGTLNEQYVIASNTLPTPWPVDVYGPSIISNNTYITKTSVSSVATVATYRIMTDAPKISLFVSATNFMADLFIDGKPYASNPITLAATTGYGAYGFQTITFPSAKPRLIEWRSVSGLVGIYVAKPYRAWRPAPEANPKIAVVGDSYVLPTTMNDASTGQVTAGNYLRGTYQRMTTLLGVTSLVTDGIGGTGYLAGGGSSLPYTHSSRLSWLTSASPDVIIIHGGGCNDLYNSFTVNQTITAATSYFQGLRNSFPKARLIFVEGFSPPVFTPATYNPNYIAIRQGVQAAVGISNMYYLDIATTRPSLTGSGYVTATNGTGNSDIYVGSDGAHPTIKGHEYIRNVLAGKIRRVLADDGRLDGTLVL